MNELKTDVQAVSSNECGIAEMRSSQQLVGSSMLRSQVILGRYIVEVVDFNQRTLLLAMQL
jgi:hypothetical protein